MKRIALGKGLSLTAGLLLFLSSLSLNAFAVEQGISPSTGKVEETSKGFRLRSGDSSLEIEVLENKLVRVYLQTKDRTSPRTLVLDPAPKLLKSEELQRRHEAGAYSLSTSGLSVRLNENAPFPFCVTNSSGQELLCSNDPFRDARFGNITFKHAEGETLYGMKGLVREDNGATFTRNGGGSIAAGVQGDSGAPWLFTSTYGLLVDSDGGEVTTRDESFTFHHSSRPDIEFFVAVGSPMETMAAMSRLVGPPPLPPKWTLGFLNSQWGATQAEVEQIVATYRQKHLPIDGFILDFDWKAWGEDNYGEWRWNSTSGPGAVAPNKFPDGASGAFAKELAAQGIKLGGILKPRILLTAAGPANRMMEAARYAEEHHFWYPGEEPSEDYFSHQMCRNLDFNKAEVRSWFWDHLRPAFQTGMTAWWNDEADYQGSTIFNNFQFLNMGRMLYEGQRAISDLRVWSINRNFYLGSSRYGYAGWSGDIVTGFGHMAYEKKRMISALNTGEFHWSMDTGGFAGHPSEENYARWIEFAAFVPIMRVHGDHNEKRQPWVYGPKAEAAARYALELRYSLLPYIYSFERQNTEGQVGLVRPLFWAYPNDPQAATNDAEWMFGDALLVAPIVAHGLKSQKVYLPNGEWFDYTTGKHYSGGQSIEVATDSVTWKDIPMFVRAGSTLATQSVQDYVGQKKIEEIVLDIFPSSTESSFVVYDDDGETYSYEKEAFLRQVIRSVQTNGTTQIILDPSQGSYRGGLKTYLLRIHAEGTVLELNGRKTEARSEADLHRGSKESWAKTRDRFGPVAVFQITAGGRKTERIVLK